MKLFAFKGRVRRRSFLIYFICSSLIAEAIGWLGTVAFASIQPTTSLQDVPTLLRSYRLPAEVAYVVLALCAVGLVVATYSFYSFAVRRFHDFNLTGWLAIISLFGMHALVRTDVPGPFSLGELIWYVVAAALPGTKGANSFGEDPRAKSGVEVSSVF